MALVNRLAKRLSGWRPGQDTAAERPRKRSRHEGRAPRAALPSGRCGPRRRTGPPLHGHLPGWPRPRALHAASLRWPLAPAAEPARPARPGTRAQHARAPAAARRPRACRARRAGRRLRRAHPHGCRWRRPPRRAPRRPPRPAAAGPARPRRPGPGSTPGARHFPLAQTLPLGRGSTPAPADRRGSPCSLRQVQGRRSTAHMLLSVSHSHEAWQSLAPSPLPPAAPLTDRCRLQSEGC